MSNESKMIVHDISLEDGKWRHWGHSAELARLDYRPSDKCDFCGSDSGTFFKTTCHCGLPGVHQVDGAGLRITASWSPENGDFTFYCCEPCVNELTRLIQEQDQVLLNHENLIKVVEKLRSRRDTT